ncbi:DNA replication initiation control protein YabA [Paenibacillus validus]|uniref:Replication initiation control protein YabA n=1 Tax=Paenibacillus validus TaxID=44253 RepID=A0A7X2ZEC4_9BACL|nr:MULTISPECIES: DNA replication initiation control protein YabA [Paenibacillus]MED4601106.1 DNA replication initiation control protein YabA [Paenibacillus validus]MED4608271.1 DNA replication initiation control protein YabA [Paenibacillus validus]MUG73363.1 DNA replication initiation control protein YabA [Paenibacillus validus]
MVKRDIFIQIDQMEEQVGTLYAELGQIKQQIIELLEENKRLGIENSQLRKLLKKDAAPALADPASSEEEAARIKEVTGEGLDNLTRIYHEGFHICNVNYGHLRTEGDCLFCMSFLNK